MKTEDVLISNELPPIHKQLRSIMDTAYYDLNVLRELQKEKRYGLSQKEIQRVIAIVEANEQQAYELDTICGTATHKFSSASCRPLDKAVRFFCQPLTKLIRVQVQPVSPLLHRDILLKPWTLHKLIPDLGESVTIEKEKTHMTYEALFRQQIKSAIGFDFICNTFLANGINSFIAAANDTFLMLPEDVDAAIKAFHKIMEELELERKLFFFIDC